MLRLLLLAALVWPAGPALADPVASSDYFPLPTGASWEHELRDSAGTQPGTLTVVGPTLFDGETTQRVDAVDSDGTTTTYATSDARGVLLHGQTGPDPDVGMLTLDYDPPIVLVAGEVEQDDVGGSGGNVFASAPGFPTVLAGTYSYSWQVPSIGPSTNPAGTFCDALTVTSSLTFSVPGEAPLVATSTAVFARSVGEVHDLNEVDGEAGEIILVDSSLPLPASDLDCDGLPDATDNCVHWANAVQADVDENGIGDACECGDQTGDGRVNISDVLAINAVIFELQAASPLCDTNDDGLCNVSDILGANGKIFGAPAYCARFPAP